MALGLDDRATLPEVWTTLAALLPTMHLLRLSSGIAPLHGTQKYLNDQKEAQLASTLVIGPISSNFSFS